MSTQTPESKASIHTGHRKRLRQRYARSGLDDYADHEVLELLLTYAIPRVDVNQQAHRLIDHFGSLAAVLDASPEELCEIEGIGSGAAQFLSMIPSVFRRYEVCKHSIRKPMDKITRVCEFLHAKYRGITCERVYLLLLDNSLKLIDCCHLCDGTVNCSSITVRKIAELCLFKRASCAILAHNHPQGVAFPSASDIEVTWMVESALETIGVHLLEHIVLTDHDYSTVILQQKGLLRSAPFSGKVDPGFFEKFYGVL